MLMAACRGRKGRPGWGTRPPPFEMHLPSRAAREEGPGFPSLLEKEREADGTLGSVSLSGSNGLAPASYFWFVLSLTCLLLASPRQIGHTWVPH